MYIRWFNAGIRLFNMSLGGSAVWMGLIAVIGFALGTMFAVSAPLASDCFRLEHFGAIFGLVFTAYGFVAGILGPWQSGYLLDCIGSDFLGVFLYRGGLYIVSALLVLKTTPQTGCMYQVQPNVNKKHEAISIHFLMKFSDFFLDFFPSVFYMKAN